MWQIVTGVDFEQLDEWLESINEDGEKVKITGFCSIFGRWSHDYGKSGTYSKVCKTLVHIPVDFDSTKLK